MSQSQDKFGLKAAALESAPAGGGYSAGAPPVGDTAPIEKSDLGPRDRILQAALELFVRQGYFNTNVPDISKQSRCSVGSIYHHFLNKEEIAEQLYSAGINQFRQALTKGLENCSTLQDTVRSTVIAFLRFAEEHHLLARYLWLARHSEFLSKKVAKPTVVGFDELGRKLTRIIKDGVRKKEIQNLKAEIIWNIIFGIPVSFLTDWLDGYTRSTTSQVADTLADACWAALKGANCR